MNKFQILFLLALFAIGVANISASYSYSRKVEEKSVKISALSEEIKEKIIKTAEIKAEIKEEIEVKEEKEEIEDAFLSSPDYCIKCHEKSNLYLFHTPEGIINISKAKKMQPRLCSYCHGERVMIVHFEGIKEKRIKCEACHIRGSSGFIVPEKKESMVLICELCHARGNYIKIHIDGSILENAEIDEKWIKTRRPKNCILCHNEEVYRVNIAELHKIKTQEAGRLEKLPFVSKIQKEKLEKNITAAESANIEKIWSKIVSSNSIIYLQ